VATLAVDAIATHVILTDGTLWGWGDDAQGAVGDGHELDFATTTEPYAWDWGPCEMMVLQPVQIAKEVTDRFVNVFSTPIADFYIYATTSSGAVYSWGRNKTGDLGTDVVAPNSIQAAAYPNGWDVTSPTLVSPMTVTAAVPVESPICQAHPDAGSCLCPNGTNHC
jgi:alpha-tubulin suppressor-like RCC1 family protein